MELSGRPPPRDTNAPNASPHGRLSSRVSVPKPRSQTSSKSSISSSSPASLITQSNNNNNNNNNSNNNSINNNSINNNGINKRNQNAFNGYNGQFHDPYAGSLGENAGDPPLHATIPFILGGFKDDPPYVAQSDPQMETAAMIEKRRRLKASDAVKAAVGDLIDTCFRSSNDNNSSNNNSNDGDNDNRYTRDEYERVMTAIARYLVPSMSIVDVKMAVSEDWERDVKADQSAGKSAKGTIGRDALESSVAELVDIWTLGVSAAEYVAFARALKSAVVVSLAKPSVGLVVDNDVVNGKSRVEVTQVRPGSAAEHAGMIQGGYILSVNGTPTPTSSDFKATLKQYRAGDKITLREIRGSKKSKEETDTRLTVGAAGMGMKEFIYHQKIVECNKASNIK